MKTVISVLLIAPLFFLRAYGEDIYDVSASQYGIYALEDGLSPTELEMTGRLEPGKDNSGSLLRSIVSGAVKKVKDEVKNNLHFASALGAITVLCAVASSMTGGEGIAGAVNIAACAAAAVAVMGDMNGIITQTVEAINRMSDYSKTAMPVLYTAAAACGQAGASAAKYAAVSMALDVVMTLSCKALVPGVYAFLALSLSDSLFPNSLIACFANGAKWLVTTAMTLMTIALCAYIGTTGLVAGSVDAAAVKTAKTVISSALPVVGGILSDASGAVLSAAAVIKYSAGTFALAAVCVMCVAPVAVITVKLLVLKLFSALSETVPGIRVSRLLGAAGTAAGMLLGLLGCSAVMLFISVTAGIKAVTL